MKSMTEKEYAKMAQKASPNSPSGKNCVFAFITGGGICMLGQFLCNLYQQWGVSLPLARAGVSISLIFLSALLTALGWFDNIARFAGAGTLVPITGFANSVTCAAMDNKAEGWVLGTASNSFKLAGAVIVMGTVSAFAMAFLLWLVQII